MNRIRIGFLDSGIGGVTVLKECMRILPNFEYIYYSDSINNPYGDKSVKELNKIVDNIVINLINKKCNIIVIACNIVSCMCVDYLRNKYRNIKFLAIEPAVKLAYDKNNGKNTLIMATKGTLDSEKFQKLYSKYNNDNFYLLSCVGLANLIEENEYELLDKYLVDNLSKYKNLVSSVVLGCTHYPLIKDNIRKILGDVVFFDGAKGVANQLKRVIGEYDYKNNIDGKVLFFDSSCDIIKEQRFFEILEGDYE